MAQLSAKQYIQTKARSLPVYKCLVNKDWETARLANVIVMRRHVNGNLTAGVYLVDLLCLGVKDALYIFNEPETGIEERLGLDFGQTLKEIDYDLAHNIVYAGHDFAMDFEIKPHADFAVAKFILEEDNDDIPLIEIEAGEDGKPHLFVFQPGQYSDALAKLKKYAGEDNYYYTIGEEDKFENDDEDNEDDNDYDEEGEGGDWSATDEKIQSRSLDEFELGTISSFDAQFVTNDELLDEEKVDARFANERLNIKTELTLRTLKRLKPAFFEYDNDLSEPDTDFFDFSADVTEEQQEEYDELEDEIVTANTEGGEDRCSRLAALAEKYRLNPLVVSNIYEALFLIGEPEHVEKVKGYLEQLSPQYTVATLMLALSAVYHNEGMQPFEFIYNSTCLTDAYPGNDELGNTELGIYSLIQVLVKLNSNNLNAAIHFYYFNALTDTRSWIFPIVQFKLAEAALAAMKDDLDNQNKPTMRTV